MNLSKIRLIVFCALFVAFGATQEASGQNLITVPFTNGFVGDNTGNNVSSNSYYLSGAQGLGWSNVQFAQNSTANIFVAQGNDIIGMVLITDALGVEHTINGFIKWRAPSGNVTTICFQPGTGVSEAIATNGFNGNSSYTIDDTKYIGLTFNGEVLTINPVPGEVTGNAATAGLLDLLNNYLAQFPSISIGDLSVNENDGTVYVTVTLSATSTSTITVHYTTNSGTATGGLDYTSTSGTVTFAPGQTTALIPLDILMDLLNETSEGFTLTLTNPSNASILDGTSNVTIANYSEADTDGDGVTDAQELLDGTNPEDPCEFLIASANTTPSAEWNNLDCDSDGITNQEELNGGTDPLNPDTDGDGVSDAQEILDGTNPNDPCDFVSTSITLPVGGNWNNADCDNDGITNQEELNGGTDPNNPDTDGDGVTDAQELLDGTNPNDPCSFVSTSITLPVGSAWNNADCDNDGITNQEELNGGTDPSNPDTDGDGVSDAQEILDGTDPTNPCDLLIASVTLSPSASWNTLDCDGDGIPNSEETNTDPFNPDSDGDGVLDLQEILDGTNPNDPCELVLASVTITPSLAWFDLDCDGDGLPNGQENGTDPLNPDTDGDGVSDAQELLDGTNPNDPCSFIATSVTLAPAEFWFALDCDNDGLINIDEINAGTNINNPDSDGDGVTDGQEVIDGTDPNDPCSLILASATLTPSEEWMNTDCDNDGSNNGEELANGTDPFTPNINNQDTDGDGVTDAQEILDGTNPNDPCSYVASSVTATPTSNWANADCDGDGYTNAEELAAGNDPLNPCSPNACDVIIPNCISPNNDNINDVFVIDGIEAFPGNEITIFNRWGATVFHTTNYQNNWNGTSENNLNVGGNELPVGTYFYVLDLHEEGKDVLKGYIFLQR